MEPASGARFSLSGITDFTSFPADGSAVRVSVLERIDALRVRIRIAGQTFVAGGMANCTPGTEFTARIRYSGSTVFVQPLQGQPESDVFARLGVPSTPVSTFLLTFFQGANYRLDTVKFRTILSVSAKFPGREKRAAEAAAILVMQGIDPDEQLVALLMNSIDGFSGGTDSEERDVLAFINQKKGHERHWMVFPFRKNISGRTITGSVRFLVDTALEAMVRTVLTVHDGKRAWDFVIEGDSCTYTHSPDPDTVTTEKVEQYLKRILSEAGISRVLRSQPGDDSEVYSGIDVEI